MTPDALHREYLEEVRGDGRVLRILDERPKNRGLIVTGGAGYVGQQLLYVLSGKYPCTISVDLRPLPKWTWDEFNERKMGGWMREWLPKGDEGPTVYHNYIREVVLPSDDEKDLREHLFERLPGPAEVTWRTFDRSRGIAEWDVIHLAGESSFERCERKPDEARAGNAELTARLLRLFDECGLKINCFVFASTAMVYREGAEGHEAEGEDGMNVDNVYARTKLAAEREVIRHSVGADGSARYKPLILRVANVVGTIHPDASPGVYRKGTLFGALTECLRSESGEFVVYGDGNARRHFVSIASLIEIIDKTLAKGHLYSYAAPILNVGHEECSVNEILENLVENIGFRTDGEPRKRIVVRHTTEGRAGEPKAHHARFDKLEMAADSCEDRSAFLFGTDMDDIIKKFVVGVEQERGARWPVESSSQ